MTHTILLMLLSCLLQAGASGSADSKPLPELDSFLQNIRKHLHSDRIIQSRYACIERAIFRELDSDGKVKKTETRVYEVYPSIEERLTYRKLIFKNVNPLGAEEIRKQDSAFDKEHREWEQKLQRENADEKQRREAKEMEERRKEEGAVDEALRLYRIALAGREQLEGIPVIALC